MFDSIFLENCGKWDVSKGLVHDFCQISCSYGGCILQPNAPDPGHIVSTVSYQCSTALFSMQSCNIIVKWFYACKANECSVHAYCVELCCSYGHSCFFKMYCNAQTTTINERSLRIKVLHCSNFVLID